MIIFRLLAGIVGGLIALGFIIALVVWLWWLILPIMVLAFAGWLLKFAFDY